MSVPFDPYVLTRRTTANMTDKEWFLVKASGDDDLALAGAGELAIGALTNDVADGSTSAVHLGVQVGRIIKVKCAGAITAGALAMADGNGKAVAATDGNYAFGIALETHADKEIGAFLWAPSYLETT